MQNSSASVLTSLLSGEFSQLNGHVYDGAISSQPYNHFAGTEQNIPFPPITLSF
jgi:hypothetical protein